MSERHDKENNAPPCEHKILTEKNGAFKTNSASRTRATSVPAYAECLI